MKKENLKLYTKTTLTLCIIAGASAAIVGLANYFTAPIIANNTTNLEKQAVKAIYPEATSIVSEYDEAFVEKNSFSSISDYWKASSGERLYGYVFKTEESNAYGTISLIIGINEDLSVEQVTVIKNTESYATTINEHIVDTYNGDKNIASGDIASVDVNCGATYGAKLVRAMVLEADNCAKVLMK